MDITPVLKENKKKLQYLKPLERVSLSWVSTDGKCSRTSKEKSKQMRIPWKKEDINWIFEDCKILIDNWIRENFYKQMNGIDFIYGKCTIYVECITYSTQ